MSACQLREPLSGTIEVGPTVSDVGHEDFRAHNQGRRDRCSHRGTSELLVTLEDNNVGSLHTMLEQFAPRGVIRLPLTHPWEDIVHNGLDSQAARLLTVHMPSHTIRDHKQ